MAAIASYVIMLIIEVVVIITSTASILFILHLDDFILSSNNLTSAKVGLL